jgi:hypothetical protein
MTRKKMPPPLHVNLHWIEQERLHVARRTQTRIAALLSQDTNTETECLAMAHEIEGPQCGDGINCSQVRGNWHSCLNMFCFYLLLVIANLLFCQWLYINTKSRNL